jgi:hypothetical protein
MNSKPPSGQRADGMTADKDKKKKKVCRRLEEHEAQRLARLVIEQGENGVRRGADRKRRTVAPAGAVTLF